METIELTDEGIWILFGLIIPGLNVQNQLIKFSLRKSLHHILFVRSVVEQRPRLARRAQLIQCVIIVVPDTV